jgi:simple sugar transport system substrate-binding protein
LLAKFTSSAAYLDSCAIAAIGFWNPQKAGMVMTSVAKKLLAGGAITDGMDLGVEGYAKVTVLPGAGTGLLAIGNGMVLAYKANYNDFLF